MSTPSAQIVRVTAVAFAVHALLLLVDVFGFALLMSLIAGIGASWWASASTVVRRRVV